MSVTHDLAHYFRSQYSCTFNLISLYLLYLTLSCETIINNLTLKFQCKVGVTIMGVVYRFLEPHP